MKSFYLNGAVKKGIILALGLACFLFVGCAEPVPLYGTWADNKGNTFSFFDDGTFSAKVSEGSTSKSYSGKFSVLLNALTLNCSKPVEFRVVTEWDIRGNMLYLEWTNEDSAAFFLTMYKVSN